jgi:prepilin-type processing-associated H-X9-DG protein
MHGFSPGPRHLRCSILGAAVLSVFLNTLASAQEKAPESLARYVPADGLALLFEHNGLDARPEAWRGTAAYKMLNETSLGAMLEDIATQLADRGLQGGPGAPINGKDAIDLLKHLASKGFAFGYCGSFNPAQPRAGVLVIRDAAKSEAFKRVVAQIPPLNEPAAVRVDAPGGRTVLRAGGPPIRFWHEGSDAVFSFAPPEAPDPVLAVLEGKAKSALADPARTALAKSGASEVPVGLFFVDLATIPPMSPQGVQLGLDGVKRVEARWAIRGKGLVTDLAVQAPRPRRGLLALFDQPPLGIWSGFKPPRGTADYTILSLDPKATVDTIFAMLKAGDPESTARLKGFADRFRARTGLSLRDDLLGKIGPKMAYYIPAGKGGASLYGMFFYPPDFAYVAELKDAKGFAANLDRLIVAANREMRAAGALVPPQRGMPARPGTLFAEFRPVKPPGRGYVLAVPPSVLPTPSGLRPTILVNVDRGVVAIAGSQATAQEALATLDPDVESQGPMGRPDAIVWNQSDPSGSLPELLVSIPSVVQVIALAAAAQPDQARTGMPPGAGGRPPFRLQIDPDAIPAADALRPYIFPSVFTMSSDASSIRISVYQAFPFPVPQMNVGTEAPVLIALLLPAVQAAREAARRAQCVNNLKQVGLAMHMYADANDGFPAAAITDKKGKPLLSWRVAILPYLEQRPLYEKFKLDEPWDSPHNRELIKYMPTIYACPSRPLTPGERTTTYRVFLGKGSLFETGRPTRIADVTDGTSNTLMVVEAKEAVPWTKPEGLPFEDPAVPLFGTGSNHSGGFNVVMADGSVRFIKMTINPQTLRALITRSGGEVVQPDGF